MRVPDGGGAADILNGGLGQDVLKGGAGADMFVFQAGDSGFAALDKVADFSAAQGDKIDFSAFHILASDLAINQIAKNSYVVALDLDHDGGYDFGVTVVSHAQLTTADFVL